MTSRMIPPLAAIACLAAYGCGSPQGVTASEQQERQNLAFNVAGRYFENTAAGTPSVLTIADEQGDYDIDATLELRGGLTAVDRTSLTAAVQRDDPSLAVADATALVGRFEAALAQIQLSVGPTFTERGGENVALDHTGDTAEIALRKTVDAVGHAAHGSYTLTATLYLTGHKGSPILDFQTTPDTDAEGHGVNGAKGLLVTVTRTAADQDGNETTVDVIREDQLRLGELTKL